MSSERWGAMGGMVFVVAFLLGAALLDLPGHDDDDARLTQFYSEQGNRLRILFGAYCLAAAGIGLLGLASVLSVRAEQSYAPLVLSRFILVVGLAAGVLLIAAGAAQSPTYAGSISLFDEPESPLTRATIPHIGYSFLLFSLLCAAALCAAVAAAIRSTRMLPSWLAWLGFVASALLLLSIFFMPIVAILVWALAVSVALWRVNPVVRQGPRGSSAVT